MGGLAAVITGTMLLAFSMNAVAQFEDYRGSDACLECHGEQYNNWKVSGHPFKLMESEKAQNRPIPLPVGFTWDAAEAAANDDLEFVSYVIGGYKWKSRYIDENGYIITKSGEDLEVDGVNQYNYLTGRWSNYHDDEDFGTKPYDCGGCHTTGWIPDEDADTDGTLEDNQDGLPGMHGIFAFGGIHCEQCHGTDHPGETDGSVEACGECHVRGGDPTVIPASGGWIKHREQGNEIHASPHDFYDCTRCHNPHKRAEFSIWVDGEQDQDGAQCGVDCHSSKMDSFELTSMYDYGVTCTDCHMPLASKSSTYPTGPHQGDIMTHIFRIDTDPAANMFTDDGSAVRLDDSGDAKVTMDFACQRCHETASLEELAKYAVDFHDTDKSLEGIGIDPGLTGHWWDSTRSGEGFMIEVAYVGEQVFVFISFYAYDSDGNQTYLFAQGYVDPMATTVDLEILIPEGGQWGDAFDPADVMRPPWGVGTFTFPNCENATYEFIPNDAAVANGYTTISGDLTRDLLEVGIACPTFDNRSGVMAVAK